MLQKSRSRNTGSVEDDAHADDAEGPAQHVPMVGAVSFCQPQPEDCGNNLDAAISGVGAASRRTFNECQQIRAIFGRGIEQ